MTRNARTVATALVMFAGLGAMAYAGKDKDDKSWTSGNVNAANSLFGPRSGMAFNFLPAVQKGAFDVFHTDIHLANGLVQQFDFFDVDPPDPDAPAPLRIRSIPSSDPDHPGRVELHFFDANAFEIFLVNADGRAVPAEICERTATDSSGR